MITFTKNSDHSGLDKGPPKPLTLYKGNSQKNKGNKQSGVVNITNISDDLNNCKEWGLNAEVLPVL